MEPRDMMLAWIDQDIAALQALAATDVPAAPSRMVWGSRATSYATLLARSAAVMSALRELADEARTLRQEARELRERAAAQERPWSDIWGIEP